MAYIQRGFRGLGDLLADAKTFVFDRCEDQRRANKQPCFVGDAQSLYGIIRAYSGHPGWSWIADRCVDWVSSASGGMGIDPVERQTWRDNHLMVIIDRYKNRAILCADVNKEFPTVYDFLRNTNYSSADTPFTRDMAQKMMEFVNIIAQRAVQRRAEALAMVNRIFTELLGRTVAGAEAEAWINRVLGEGLTEPQVRQVVLDSQEYKNLVASENTPAQKLQKKAVEEAKKSIQSTFFSLEIFKSPIFWVAAAAAGGFYYWTQVKNKSMGQLPYVGRYLKGR